MSDYSKEGRTIQVETESGSTYLFDLTDMVATRYPGVEASRLRKDGEQFKLRAVKIPSPGVPMRIVASGISEVDGVETLRVTTPVTKITVL